MFWTDRLAHALFRADITPSGDIEHIKKLDLKSLIYPRNLAVDWITSNVRKKMAKFTFYFGRFT